MPSQDGRRAVLPWKKAFDAHLARVGHSCWLAEPQRAQPANGLIGMNSIVRRYAAYAWPRLSHARLARLADDIDRGLTAVHDVQEAIRQHVADVQAIHDTLDRDSGTGAQRHAQFQTLWEQFQGSDALTRQPMGRVMTPCEPGL